MKRIILILALILTCLAAPAMSLPISAETAQQAHTVANPTEFGYGFSQIFADGNHAHQLGFNWIQSYYPPTAPQPTQVLYRIQFGLGMWTIYPHSRRASRPSLTGTAAILTPTRSAMK